MTSLSLKNAPSLDEVFRISRKKTKNTVSAKKNRIYGVKGEPYKQKLTTASARITLQTFTIFSSLEIFLTAKFELQVENTALRNMVGILTLPGRTLVHSRIKRSEWMINWIFYVWNRHNLVLTWLKLFCAYSLQFLLAYSPKCPKLKVLIQK